MDTMAQTLYAKFCDRKIDSSTLVRLFIDLAVEAKTTGKSDQDVLDTLKLLLFENDNPNKLFLHRVVHEILPSMFSSLNIGSASKLGPESQ